MFRSLDVEREAVHWLDAHTDKHGFPAAPGQRPLRRGTSVYHRTDWPVHSVKSNRVPSATQQYSPIRPTDRDSDLELGR